MDWSYAKNGRMKIAKRRRESSNKGKEMCVTIDKEKPKTGRRWPNDL